MIRTIAVALLLAGTSVAIAQQNFDQVQIRTEVVKPGIAVLFGAGGNIGVSHGPDGTILIDDQYAPLTPKIVAAVAALGAKPVKFLVNTHWHGDHTGGNENFGNAGAVILAQDHVRDRMATPQVRGARTIGPSPAAALPVITYHDGARIHLNGDVVRMMHVAHAHTDGDSIVFWEKANVVHMGDTYFNRVTLPFIDLASGGSAKGLLAGIDRVLALINDDTVVIPGHGPLARKRDLAAYRAMLADVIAKVESGRAAGQTLDQIVASKPAAAYETNPPGFISGDAFVTTIYRSLETPPPDHGPQRGGHSHGPGAGHRH